MMGHASSVPLNNDHRRNRLDRKRASKRLRTGAGGRAVVTTGTLGVGFLVLVAMIFFKTS
jgi:hypothetical protein